MELRIFTRLRAKDIFDFHFYRTGRAIFIFFMLLFFICLSAAFAKDYSYIRAFIVLSFPFVYTAYIFLYSIQKGKSERLIETVFNENGIFSRNSRCESGWRFSDITKIIETGKYIYIFIINTNIFILPKYQLGARENILFLRDLFSKNIPPEKLRLLKNDGSFNDKRKFSFNAEQEIKLAKNDDKDEKSGINPLFFTLCIITVIILLSFLSEHLKKANGLSDPLEIFNFENDNFENGESFAQSYISASEKLLIVADDILPLTELNEIKIEEALLREDEITGVKYELYDYYYSGGELAFRELDRLNATLINRLFEITDLRAKYCGEDISGFEEDLCKLKTEVEELKIKCADAINSVKE